MWLSFCALQTVGFVWGFVCQQFSQTILILLAGFVLACLVCEVVVIALRFPSVLSSCRLGASKDITRMVFYWPFLDEPVVRAACRSHRWGELKHLLWKPSVLAAISQGMQPVKLCSSKMVKLVKNWRRQLTQVDPCDDRKMCCCCCCCRCRCRCRCCCSRWTYQQQQHCQAPFCKNKFTQ